MLPVSMLAKYVCGKHNSNGEVSAAVERSAVRPSVMHRALCMCLIVVELHVESRRNIISSCRNSLPGDQDEAVVVPDEALSNWRSFMNQPALVLEWLVFSHELKDISYTRVIAKQAFWKQIIDGLLMTLSSSFASSRLRSKLHRGAVVEKSESSEFQSIGRVFAFQTPRLDAECRWDTVAEVCRALEPLHEGLAAQSLMFFVSQEFV